MTVTLMNTVDCELSPEQAAQTRERRIFGPPGCGKTTTMGRLIVEACQQFGSDGVLVCSFTKTAARELVSRNLPLDQERVGTFHSICYRLLGNPTLLTGKTNLEGWNQAHPVYFMSGGAGQSALDDPYAMDLLNDKGEGEGDQLLNELNRLRGLMVPKESWPESVQLFESCWSAYKDNTFTVDFTDLIAHCLHQRVPVMEGTRALFLDEVQDFSPLELSLARYWGAQCDLLYMAGDDDQCLYKFKGATPDAFLNPPLPSEQILVLNQSYRVPRAVHRLATTISGYIQKRQEKIYKPRDYDGVATELPDVSYTYVDPLQTLLNGWVQAGKTVAILGSCAYMLNKTKDLLREMGLPFHNPYKLHRGDWNPLTGREGTISASRRVLAFLKVSRGQGMWTYPELWMWASELEAKSIFAHGAKTAIRRAAENEEWAHSPVLTSHLQEWISDPNAPAACMRGDMDWLEPRLLEKSARSVGYACKIVKAYGPEALEQAPRVIIGTIHSVKGGEADIVVLFPDLSRAGYDEFSSEDDQDAVDSVWRMMYVGVTRAKEELYVTDAASMMAVPVIA